MPRINALPPQSAPDGADVFPSDDTSDNNTTKKISLTGLKTWLQSISSWIGNTNLLTTPGDIGGAWKSYNSFPQGWSGIDGATRYTKIGKTVMVLVDVYGTSNATTASITLPFTAVTGGGVSMVRATSNTNKSIGIAQISGTTATFYADAAGSAFASSGAKDINGLIVYTTS